jgi:hypothetical protein
MVLFENRRGMYVQVHEHRKRRKVPFAARSGLNLDRPWLLLAGHAPNAPQSFLTRRTDILWTDC